MHHAKGIRVVLLNHPADDDNWILADGLANIRLYSLRLK
jgi:hypothetical protein